MPPEAEGAASPPEATVERGEDRTHTLRAARGFSRREISEAGMSLLEARTHGLPVDVRRRSKRQENVASLKDWVMSARETLKPPEPKGKKKRKKRRAPAKKAAEERAVTEKPPKKRRRRTKAKPRKKEKSTAG